MLIVAFHFPPFYGDGNLSRVADFVVLRYLERLAVPFFFICSGFFLYRGIEWTSMDDKKERTYIFRIIRLYLIWTIIYLPYSINTFQYDEAGTVHALIIFIRDFFLTGSCFHLWYMNALAFAVFLIMILRKQGFKPKSVLIISVLLFLTGLTAQSWFGLIRPLEEVAPAVWQGMKKIGNLIVTTRNGMFEGFFYTAAGMYIALRYSDRENSIPAIGFILSAGGLLAEILLLRKLGWSRATDIYLFQAPATVFFFLCLKNMSNLSGKNYRQLRKISGLLYYIHPLVGFLIEIGLEVVNPGFVLSRPLFFGLILVFSMLISACLLKLSESKRGAFLKKLYE